MVGEGVGGPQRIQIRRAKGWRKPAGAVMVSRPSKYGNPFVADSDWTMWMAVAIGLRADKAGRRKAAVAFHRAWMLGVAVELREYAPIQDGEYSGGFLEFGDGSTRSMVDHAAGIATLGAATCESPHLPERPDVSDLAGKDLCCWCPLEEPCHADVLIELANGMTGRRAR